jgi:hypothetical protein
MPPLQIQLFVQPPYEKMGTEYKEGTKQSHVHAWKLRNQAPVELCAHLQDN